MVALSKMKLLHHDPKATDPLYNKIQEDCRHFNPPTLLRDRVEKLYETCHDLVDKKFPSQIKHKFASCYSELYFCATFRKLFGSSVLHPSDKGPDYYIQDLDCWAEVATLSDGKKDNPNSILRPESGVVGSHPKDQIILRITSSFTEKAKIIFTYIEKGLIKENQRIIICISGGWIQPIYRFPCYPVGGFPEVVSALLPIGDMALLLDENSNLTGKRTFKYKDYVNKKKENNCMETIKTNYFLDPKYSCISAVVYSYANVSDYSEGGNKFFEELGSDFFIIHNPLATINRLPYGSFKCGTEYEVEVDSNFINIKTNTY